MLSNCLVWTGLIIKSVTTSPNLYPQTHSIGGSTVHFFLFLIQSSLHKVGGQHWGSWNIFSLVHSLLILHFSILSQRGSSGLSSQYWTWHLRVFLKDEWSQIVRQSLGSAWQGLVILQWIKSLYSSESHLVAHLQNFLSSPILQSSSFPSRHSGRVEFSKRSQYLGGRQSLGFFSQSGLTTPSTVHPGKLGLYWQRVSGGSGFKRTSLQCSPQRCLSIGRVIMISGQAVSSNFLCHFCLLKW